MRSPGRRTPSSREGPCWYHCWPAAEPGALSALRLGVPVAGPRTWGTPGRALRGRSGRKRQVEEDGGQRQGRGRKGEREMRE